MAALLAIHHALFCNPIQLDDTEVPGEGVVAMPRVGTDLEGQHRSVKIYPQFCREDISHFLALDKLYKSVKSRAIRKFI